eukprot:Gregarina_sp_Poly_1__9971@NODE_65_length_16489_cov_69_850445_g56_i0_p5_GENE_NODE_65_length_16489_cov_69_850445_g56_i0NODE_65_length_16489_cov_69_850445_g56_i0_p5_ORF_typecomplete_len152_score6_41_NODE_65_length_16489_cov_69_850445_g56_i091739628
MLATSGVITPAIVLFPQSPVVTFFEQRKCASRLATRVDMRQRCWLGQFKFVKTHEVEKENLSYFLLICFHHGQPSLSTTLLSINFFTGDSSVSPQVHQFHEFRPRLANLRALPLLWRLPQLNHPPDTILFNVKSKDVTKIRRYFICTNLHN